MTWRHIMFAVAEPDAVEPSAMSKVARLVSAIDAQLELFHCAYDSDIAPPARFGSRALEQVIRELVEQRHRQLDATAQRLRALGVTVRATVRWDYPPYEGIVRQVLRHKPNLLIAQSTRRGRTARLLLTQTDYKLIEACPCPLLLIKTSRPYSDACIIAAVDPAHAHDKPAALDDAILEAASAVSGGLGAILHVYHARTPWPDVVAESAEIRRTAPEAMRAEIRAAYSRQSEAAVLELARRRSVPKERVHIEEGDTSESLPRFANGVSADIVAMGAVSRSRARRAFIGHTAERVLDALDCDVLVAKPPDFRCPVGRQSIHRLPKSGSPRVKYIW